MILRHATVTGQGHDSSLARFAVVVTAIPRGNVAHAEARRDAQRRKSAPVMPRGGLMGLMFVIFDIARAIASGDRGLMLPRAALPGAFTSRAAGIYGQPSFMRAKMSRVGMPASLSPAGGRRSRRGFLPTISIDIKFGYSNMHNTRIGNASGAA